MFRPLNNDFELTSKTMPPDVIIGGIKIVQSSSLGGLRDIWQDVEAESLCTFFQSYGWYQAWLETIGQTLSISPAIVLGQEISGTTAFILPFQIRRVGPLRVLEWLGQQDSTYGAGVYARNFAKQDWFSNHFSQLLCILPGFDVVNLQDCPEFIVDETNPLSSIHRFTAANRSFDMTLTNDYAALFHSKRSAKSISKIRRRDERLKSLGRLQFAWARDPSAFQTLMQELYTFKDQQLAELGVGSIFGETQREFYDRLSREGCLNLFRLSLDDKTVCLALGAVRSGVFYLMVTAVSPTAPMPLSPGDMLLRHVIEWCCNAGLRRFDFSAGQSDYKLLWADREIQLFHYFSAQNWRGVPLAFYFLATQSAKRLIKTHPLLWRAFCRLRRGRAGWLS